MSSKSFKIFPSIKSALLESNNSKELATLTNNVTTNTNNINNIYNILAQNTD